MQAWRYIRGTPREWAIRLSVGAALGAFFGLIGPFGSYGAPLAIRLAYWITGFCLGVSAFSLSIRAAMLLAPKLDLPPWFALGAAVALCCIPYSVVIGWLFNDLRWPRLTLRFLLERYGQTLLVAIPLTAGYVAVARLRHGQSGPQEAGAAPQPSSPSPTLSTAALPLLARLPDRLGRDLIALQMEDHYVRAHTPLGSDLVLTPMAQAVEGVGTVEGMRVHRSWWVARAAVEGAVWEGRNLRLKLRGGLEAPVARAQVAQVRAAGWLGGGDRAG